MEITLRYLKERIIQLERDKVALTSEADDHRQEAKVAQDKLKEAATVLRDVERKLVDIATGRINLLSIGATENYRENPVRTPPGQSEAIVSYDGRSHPGQRERL